MQMYNIHEMVSHLGRKRKLPMVLGVDLSRGLVMISPEKLKDGPSREWTADKLSNYSIEGKHIFMELIRPSKSVDFHAGNKDTAQQIVSVLGELAGAARAGGLREVIAAGTGSGLKRGQMLYEFMAQGDDEVTVAVGDEVIVLDDTRSEEWWMIRRLKNGTEGVVPSSYVEISGTTNPTPARAASGRSYAEQNRMEEERMAREAARTPRDEVSVEVRGVPADTAPVLTYMKFRKLPARLVPIRKRPALVLVSRRIIETRIPIDLLTYNCTEPDSLSVRVWTDRSGTFKVDAEFLGLKDGKIHLHKTNGVKIAVPAAKMSTEDLDYVDRVTGNSIEQEKSLPDTRKLAAQKSRDMSLAQPSAASLRQTSGATLQRSEQSQLDWFEFFLACGCNPQICERYSTTFDKDQMGEENLQDINATLLRTLGLKEGDILRVMKHLDARFGRSKPDFDASESTNGDGGGGLFSGSNGTLKNNTRKGRPAPAVETNDTVNPKVFETSKDNSAPTLLPVKLSQRETSSGFDDDAWDVKPSRLAQRPENHSSTIPTSTAIQRPAGTGAMADLSLLSSSIDYPVAAPAITASSIQSIPALEPQRTGATTSFFNQLPQSSGSQSSAQQNLQRAGPQAVLNQQPKAFPPAQPSARSFSAPLAVSQPSEYTQLAQQPQMTGNHAQMAPSGQSLNEIGQRRYQQQYNQQSGFAYALNGIVPAQTGYQSTLPQSAGLAQFPQSQVMGYPQNMQASYLTGSMTGSPFADPSPRPLQLFQYQQTGYQQQTYLPQPLQPQRTGMNGNMPMPLQPQITGMNGYTNSMTTPSFTSVQSITPQQQHTPAAAPLQPQKTGPAPPIRFGVAPTALPLVSQPTGRRANLAQASKMKIHCP